MNTQKKEKKQYPLALYREVYTLSSLPKDSAVLLALSGGADSRALLHLLSQDCGKHGAKLYAAHVNHMIRGKEAERDRDFCLGLCQSYGIECFVLEADVPKLASESGNSIETEARRVRYSFFEKIMEEHNIKILATAHNADDNFETVLFNLSRGSGIRGLCGISPSRDFGNGKLVRPLINVSKKDIIDYCKANSLDFVTDSTNADTGYSRNRIRAKVIPELLQINSDALSSVGSATELLREDADFIDAEVKKFLQKNADGKSIPIPALTSVPYSISSRAVIALSGLSLERAHVDSLLSLSQNAIPHSSVSLPQMTKGIIEDGRLMFVPDEKKKSPEKPYRYSLKEGVNRFDGFEVEISSVGVNSEKNQKTDTNIYKIEMKTTVESDKINGELFVKNRAGGDTLLIGGMHKKLKKLLCDKKVPAGLRNTLPLIADGDGLLFVPLVGQRDGTRGKDGNIIEITVRL